MEKPVVSMKHCDSCGMAVPTGTLRCPRCNHLLLSQLSCQGNCRACAAKCPSQTDKTQKPTQP